MPRVILITGATSGFGLETAIRFKENDDAVIIASRNKTKIAEVIEKKKYLLKR